MVSDLHEFVATCAPEQNRSGSDSAGHRVAFEHPFAST